MLGWHEKICSLKENGGLGINEIGKFNVAPLAKWKWRLGIEKGEVWKELLEGGTCNQLWETRRNLAGGKNYLKSAMV